MKKWMDLIEWPEGRSKECPSCGQQKVSTRVQETVVTYGEGANAADIPVQIPVHHCDSCELDFTDEFAEAIKHAAICRHLGVMTPDEVIALREIHGSRAEFARLTRIGEASIARWETGNLIQNAAYDQFLYLLSYPDNVIRLRARLAEQIEEAAGRNTAATAEVVSDFDALKRAGLFDRKKADSQHFTLRKG